MKFIKLWNELIVAIICIFGIFILDLFREYLSGPRFFRDFETRSILLRTSLLSLLFNAKLKSSADFKVLNSGTEAVKQFKNVSILYHSFSYLYDELASIVEFDFSSFLSICLRMLSRAVKNLFWFCRHANFEENNPEDSRRQCSVGIGLVDENIFVVD